MTPLPILRSTSCLALLWRASLMAIALFACLLMNADYVRGQSQQDDHADTPASATAVTLGGSVEGRIDPAPDADYFVFDLSAQTGPTDVWIYATGELNSVGGLYDDSLDLIASNDDSRVEGRESSFHVRAILDPGEYYVLVRSFASGEVGDYALHVEPVPDHGDTANTATRLELNAPQAARLDARGDDHYFRLDVAEQSSLLLSARNPVMLDGDEETLPVGSLAFVLTDAGGDEVAVNVRELGIPIRGESQAYGFLIRDDFAPGAYFLKVTTPPEDYGILYPVSYTVNAVVDADYVEFIESCEARSEAPGDSSIEDPLYACQWHLDQPSGEDVNVRPVWDDGLTGEGVNVVVVDDGMDWTHEDLIDNVDASLHHDYTDGVGIHHPYRHHGTSVAGVIAARDNDIGVRGVAPRATIFSHNLLAASDDAGLAGLSDADIANSMSRNSDVTAVSSNSWGAADGPWASPAGGLWEFAVEDGVTNGNDGRGVFYVWAAGNGRLLGDDSNLDGRANFYAVTAVCAVDDAGAGSVHSEMGANLWVCAPSGGATTLDGRGMVTAENSDRYRDDFGGTFSAAPVVSGVAALALEANPDLTWRDVKLILAGSARMNDPGNLGWEQGAAEYRDDSNRYHFNHEYGFGVVDAAAAVALAKSWTNLPALREVSVESAKIDALIPDAYEAASIETVTLTLTLDIDTEIEFTEFVEIDTAFQHNSFRDLDIELESPSGAVSKLLPAYDTVSDDGNPDNDHIPMRGPYRLGSARHLGEDPNGTWKLRITDVFRFGFGIIESWGITIYGHSYAPVVNLPPVFAGGESTVRSVAENTPAGGPVGDPVAADDYDALAYTLGGPDAALFNIDSASGQIAVGAGTTLDYEARASYAVTVTATDPSRASDTIAVSIAVTDVTLGELGDRYDADHDENISRDELIRAIRDYLDSLISRPEVLQLINLFLFS